MSVKCFVSYNSSCLFVNSASQGADRVKALWCCTRGPLEIAWSSPGPLFQSLYELWNGLSQVIVVLEMVWKYGDPMFCSCRSQFDRSHFGKGIPYVKIKMFQSTQELNDRPDRDSPGFTDQHLGLSTAWILTN